LCFSLYKQELWDLADNLGNAVSAGLKEEDIRALPVHNYIPGAIQQQQADCSVCMSSFSDGENIKTLPCCHMYHTNCIDTWLTVSIDLLLVYI